MRDAFCREASEGRRGGSAFSAVNYPQRLRRQSRDTAEHRLVLWSKLIVALPAQDLIAVISYPQF